MERCNLAEENNKWEEKLKIEQLVEHVEKCRSSVQKSNLRKHFEEEDRKKEN